MLSKILYFIITILILVAPALYNRYPLVYFDTGAYLERAVDFIPPFDRSIGYSIFIRCTTWLVSTWPVILIQGLLVSFLLFRLIHIFFKDAVYWKHFALLLTLSFSTSLAWYTSQLMPDIFSLVFALVFLLILLEEQISKGMAILYGALLMVSIGMHLSHFPLAALLIALMIILWLFKVQFVRELGRLKWLVISVPFLLCALGTAGYNAMFDRGFHLSLAPNVFITANLGEMGILKQYLDENCPKSSHTLCDIKDDLPIETGGYLWSSNSALQNHPGGWQALNEECAPIVHDFLTSPRYLKWFLFASFKASVKQLFQVDLASGLQHKYGEGSPPYWPIKTHYTNELNEFLGSVQGKGDPLPILFFRGVNYVSLFIALMAIAWATLTGRLDKRLLWLVLAVFTIYVLHASITGVLANVYERLQCRVLPLIQLTGFIIIMLQLKKRTTHAPEP